MVFNSYEFIFVFLPTVVVVFFALGKVSRAWALRWVIGASIFFYAWWRPLNVLIIAPSVLINFALARLLQRLGKQGNKNNCGYNRHCHSQYNNNFAHHENLLIQSH